MKTKIILLLALLLSGFLTANDSLLTVAQARSKTYRLLGTDTTGTSILDTATMSLFVKDATVDAQSDIGKPRAKKIVVVADQSSYFVDEGLTWIKGITLDTNNTFYALKPVELDRVTDMTYYNNLTGTFRRPQFFVRHGDSIKVYPAPVESDTIQIFYYARDKFPYSNADTIFLPVEYRNAVVYKAAHYAELRRKNFDKANMWLQLYSREIAMLRHKYQGMEVPLKEEQNANQ